MPKFRRIMSLFMGLFFLFALFGCAPKTPQETPMGESGTWSIYLYLCGSNLETKMGAAGHNLDEILSSEIPENVNVVIQTGGAKKWRSHDIPNDSLCRYTVRDGKLSLLEALPLANMGAEETFEAFLTYCVENYPAEKMCPIIWDHGGGSLNGVANDENFGFDALSLAEMEGALLSVSSGMTDRFELFGFDACLMANLETAEMLAPFARYLLASEEIEPSGGGDYSALFSAIGKDKTISGGELGKAVCDGYFAKCEESEKESTATLSVTDLEAFAAVEEAFDSMTRKMGEKIGEATGIRTVAQSAKNSQKFGGTSDIEGYSNLIDLRHFAENAQDLEESAAVISAVEKAVLYEVKGKVKSKSGGLSFFYPLHYDEEQLSEYCGGICPSMPYREYLTRVYGNIPEEPIVFLNKGSVLKDGSFSIQLAESSRNYILSIEFDLVEYSVIENGDELRLGHSKFGRDNDIFRDEDTLSYHSNFRGIWLALNGCKLFVTPVEKTEEYIIFTAPIFLNGEKTNLRFAFIWDDAYVNGGYYKMLGAWNGIDPVTGMSDKELTLIKSTDEITAYYPYREVVRSADGEWHFGTLTMREKEVPGGEYTIEEDPLENEIYIYQFVVTDIFGREYYSDAAGMLMTKTYDELKANPLLDGEYAARVDRVMEAEGESVLEAL